MIRMDLNFYLVLFSVVHLYLCQNSNDSDEKIKGGNEWEDLFHDHGIQPDVVRKIPRKRIKITTSPDGDVIKTASTRSINDLMEMPKFSWEADPKKLYALFLLNPDVPSRREAFEAEWQHMTILNIPGTDVLKGDQVIEYSPKYEHPQAAGVQRVVALVFEQKEKIDTSSMTKFDKKTLRQSNGDNRGDFHIKPFIFKAKLNDDNISYAGEFFYIAVPSKDSYNETHSKDEINERNIGIQGSKCKSKDDCHSKFLCINETCQVRVFVLPQRSNLKQDYRTSDGDGKKKSHPKGTKSGSDENGEQYEETDETERNLILCSDNAECKDGRICKENYCQKECNIDDDCDGVRSTCDKGRCINPSEREDKKKAKEFECEKDMDCKGSLSKCEKGKCVQAEKKEVKKDEQKDGKPDDPKTDECRSDLDCKGLFSKCNNGKCSNTEVKSDADNKEEPKNYAKDVDLNPKNPTSIKSDGNKAGENQEEENESVGGKEKDDDEVEDIKDGQSGEEDSAIEEIKDDRKVDDIKNEKAGDQEDKKEYEGKSNGQDLDKDSLKDVTAEEDYEDEKTEPIKIPEINPELKMKPTTPTPFKAYPTTTTKSTTTTMTTTTPPSNETERELLVKEVYKVADNGSLAIEDEEGDIDKDEVSERSDPGSDQYEEAEVNDEEADDKKPDGNSIGDDVYTVPDDDSLNTTDPKKPEADKGSKPDDIEKGDNEKIPQAVPSDSKKKELTDYDKTFPLEKSKKDAPSDEKGPNLERPFIPPRSAKRDKPIGVDIGEDKVPPTGEVPDDLLGYYKFPKECDFNKGGSCRYSVRWFKASTPNEIKFIITVKGANTTSIGFAYNKEFAGSDLITVNDDLMVEDSHINSKNEVRKDPARNLIGAHAEMKGDDLVLTFTKQIQTDDTLNDIDLGKPGGVFFFFDGAAIGKNHKFVFLPKRIDLSSYFDREAREKEIDKFPKYPKEVFDKASDPLEMALPPDLGKPFEKVCQKPSNDGRRFVSGRQAFTSYVTCDEGGTKVRSCPSNSLYYNVLQCCVPAYKFPCLNNCIQDHTEAINKEDL